MPVGLNRTIKAAFALAPTINFEVQGSSHRTPGKFILLSLRNTDKDSPMAKILPGEWFTSVVNHAFLFDKKTYINNITCVKPHTNEPVLETNVNWDNFNKILDTGTDEDVDNLIDDILNLPIDSTNPQIEPGDEGNYF